MSRPLNYSTKVPAARTVAEVTTLLAEAGADAIGTTYSNRKPTGVSFVLNGNPYRLPVDHAGMHRAILAAERRGDLRGVGGISKAVLLSADHSERVAWRVVLQWLEAQLALVQADLARVDQVMLPYLQVDHDVSLYARWAEQQQLAIESAS